MCSKMLGRDELGVQFGCIKFDKPIRDPKGFVKSGVQRRSPAREVKVEAVFGLSYPGDTR